MPDAPKTQEKHPAASRIFIFILIILVIVLGIDAVHNRWEKNKKQPAQAEEKTAVLNAVLIKPKTVSIQKKYIGYVIPVHSVDILPYMPGFIENIHIQGGQEVKAGETLLTLQQGEYKAQLDQTAAAVMQAEAAYKNASAYYKRVQAAGSKAISQADRDKAKAAYLETQAALEQAKANYNYAQVMYDYTIIKSPISGIAGNISLTKGDYVSPAGSPLAGIIQYSPIRVVFSITDKDYLDEIMKKGGKLLEGEQIKLRLANGDIFEQSGQFRFADNALNRPTSSVALYADFKNDNKILLANAYVDVLIEKNQVGILIPQNEIEMTPQGNFITIADSSAVSRVPVEIIAPYGKNFLIKNTFKAGDYLITGKTKPLAPHQKFKLNILTNKTE